MVQPTDPWNTQMGYAPTDLMAGLYPWATYIPNLAYNLTALQTGEAGSNYRAQLDAQSRMRIASMQAGVSWQAAALGFRSDMAGIAAQVAIANAREGGDTQRLAMQLKAQFGLADNDAANAASRLNASIASENARAQAPLQLQAQMANLDARFKLAEMAGQGGMRGWLGSQAFLRGYGEQPGFGSAFVGGGPFEIQAPNISSPQANYVPVNQSWLTQPGGGGGGQVNFSMPKFNLSSLMGGGGGGGGLGGFGATAGPPDAFSTFLGGFGQINPVLSSIYSNMLQFGGQPTGGLPGAGGQPTGSPGPGGWVPTGNLIPPYAVAPGANPWTYWDPNYVPPDPSNIPPATTGFAQGGKPAQRGGVGYWVGEGRQGQGFDMGTAEVLHVKPGGDIEVIPMGGGAQGGMQLTAVTALKLLRLAAGLDRPALGPAQALAAISPAQAAALRAGATQVLRSVAGMPIDMQQIGALRGIPGVAEILGGGKTTGPVDTAILPERPDPVNVGMEYEGPPVVTTETPAIRVPSATPPPTFKERIGTWRPAPSQAEWRRQRRQAAPIPGAGGFWGNQTGKAFGQLGGGRGGFAEGGTVPGDFDLASIMRRMGLPYTLEQRSIAAGGGPESGANILPSLVAARTGQGLPAFQAFGGPMSLP